MPDKTLTCTICGKDFIFTEEVQNIMRENGFFGEPKKCPDCRKYKLGSIMKDNQEVFCVYTYDGTTGKEIVKDVYDAIPISNFNEEERKKLSDGIPVTGDSVFNEIMKKYVG